jgi:hypothetical protein
VTDQTGGIRITNAQVYAELLEVKAIQIEAVTELRGMKNLPDKVAAIENELARLKVIAGLSYAVFAAVLTAVTVTIVRG